MISGKIYGHITDKTRRYPKFMIVIVIAIVIIIGSISISNVSRISISSK